MRWDTIVLEVVAAVAADSAIQGVYGTDPDFRLAGERDFVGEMMDYAIIPGVEGEVWETCILQFDFTARDLTRLRAVESALRALLHKECEHTIGGVKLFSRYDGSRRLEGASDGIFARSIDFRLEYLRTRHVTA